MRSPPTRQVSHRFAAASGGSQRQRERSSAKRHRGPSNGHGTEIKFTHVLRRGNRRGGCAPFDPPPAVSGAEYAEQLSRSITFRVSQFEKDALDDIARQARRPLAELLREALGMVTSGHRTNVTMAPPELMRAVARLKADMDEVARALPATEADGSYLDRLAILSLLVAIDRKLGKLAHRHWSWR